MVGRNRQPGLDGGKTGVRLIVRPGHGGTRAIAPLGHGPVGDRFGIAQPFKWNGGTKTSVIGLNSVKTDKYTVIASYTLVADGVFCDYDPIRKKADIGSNFLERE
jgi:hypothetical protein